MTDWSLVNSIGLALLGASLSFIAARYWYRKAADKELRARVAELEKQQQLTNLVAQPIWAAIQAKLVAELTHFHEQVTDALLAKLGPPVTLSELELNLLEQNLQHREVVVDSLISPEERDAARMLPMVIRRVKAEAEAMVAASAIELQMMAVPVAPSEPAPEPPAAPATNDPPEQGQR